MIAMCDFSGPKLLVSKDSNRGGRLLRWRLRLEGKHHCVSIAQADSILCESSLSFSLCILVNPAASEARQKEADY